MGYHGDVQLFSDGRSGRSWGSTRGPEELHGNPVNETDRSFANTYNIAPRVAYWGTMEQHFSDALSDGMDMVNLLLPTSPLA